ncbi:MAG: LysR substrate-binding domain-containing protein [Halofilum sp. (in: g-proteobacteria)]|nr:LysR substrate-binding domain-containing protein [Halofilum sp. (in: g-proteobacteria)]
MDTELLRAFVAVAECEGFSAAARILNRTQSAVSLQIGRLEDRMGETLFARDSRNVVLTTAGGRLLPYARRILSLQDEARRAMGEDRRGELIRLGVSEEHASAHLPRLLPRFAATHPEVRLEITCNISSALVHDFQAGRLDVVLGVRHEPTHTGRVLGREPMVWAVRGDSDLARRDVLPLALNPEGCIFRAHALAALGRVERRWDLRYSSRSPTGINVAVQSGLAATVKTPRSLPPGCRIIEPGEDLPELGHIEIELHRTPGQTTEAFEAFCDGLENAVIEGPALDEESALPTT